LESERKRVTRLRLGLVGLFLMLIVMVALAIFAFQQRNVAIHAQADAERQSDLAQQASNAADAAAREAGRQSTLAIDAKERAEQQTRLSTSRELATAAMNNLAIDPERSVLLALHAVSVTYSVNRTVTSEAEDALHRAVLASRVRLTLSGHTGSVRGVAFSPDGSRLATASADKTVRVYSLSPNIEALMALARTRVTRSLTAEECQKFLHVEQCPPLP
jgi:hypothetical protein